MKTRTCKYAATCKFDHPPPGEDVAKAIAMDATNEDIPEDNNKMDSGITWLIQKSHDLLNLMEEI